MTDVPLYREVSAEQFLRERTMRFAPDSPEVTGIRFLTISLEEGESLIAAAEPSVNWQAELGPISQVMPLDYERYAGIVLPWVAYRGDVRHEVDTVTDAYHSFGLPVRKPLTLDWLYADFQVVEGSSAIPRSVRTLLDRFAATASTVFVKSAPYGSNEATYWAMERELFFELENPFAEIPASGGLYAMFPRGGAWYVHHPGDTPILYLAGGADLVAALAEGVKDRLVPLTLTDKYYS